MKNKVLIFLAALLVFALIFSTFGVYAESTRVTPGLQRVADNAGLLSEEEKAALESALERICEGLQFDIVIVTTNSIEGKGGTEYADDFFDYGGYGYGGNYDGCLLLIDMESREFWISTCGRGTGAISDREMRNLESSVSEYLSSGNYYNAFLFFSYDVEDLVKGEKTYSKSKNGFDPETLFKNLGFGAIAGLIVALIVVSILKSQMKSVKSKPSASDYFVNGSLVLTNSYDRFVGSYVTRVRIKDDSSGSSSTHRSSSGRVHGGGGGRF